MRNYDDIYVKFEDFVGLTFESVTTDGREIINFKATDGREFYMVHFDDCCESVYIEDIAGDLEDLVGAEILEAYESVNSSDPPLSEYDESYTWTFYRARTEKGTVVIRWYGTSNGYYSESVNFDRVN